MIKVVVVLFCCCNMALATAQQWSANVAVVSDYLFNGISQTREKPALQAGIDYAPTQNSYVGTWWSNVDYDNADLEADLYYGVSVLSSDSLNLSVGAAHYLYFGQSTSNDNNYNELTINLQWQALNIQTWYANDYFGLGARHLIMAANYHWPLNDASSIAIGVDNSRSLDRQAFRWTANADHYWHGYIGYYRNWKNLELALSYHRVNDESLAKPTLQVQITRAFSW